jgi:hypothetical protein
MQVLPALANYPHNCIAAASFAGVSHRALVRSKQEVEGVGTKDPSRALYKHSGPAPADRQFLQGFFFSLSFHVGTSHPVPARFFAGSSEVGFASKARDVRSIRADV